MIVTSLVACRAYFAATTASAAWRLPQAAQAAWCRFSGAGSAVVWAVQVVVHAPHSGWQAQAQAVSGKKLELHRAPSRCSGAVFRVQPESSVIEPLNSG